MSDPTPDPHPMNPELREYLEAMRVNIQELTTAITGNALGQEGIIPRLDNVETKVDAHDRRFLVWGSILSAAGTALVFVKDFFTAKSH
jgi:hypothetical protein